MKHFYIHLKLRVEIVTGVLTILRAISFDQPWIQNGYASIDYRYEEKATSWYQCTADDSRIPKMPVIAP
jgi:hypothetical protein